MGELQVMKVSCGNTHSMLLTKTSLVFGWGSNSKNQIGIKKDWIFEPSEVTAMRGSLDVVCGE